MLGFLIGLTIGFLGSMPVGPVNMGLISATIRVGGRYGFMLGCGAAIMDFVYMFAALSGVSLMSFNENLVLTIKISGAVILAFLGIKELVSKVEDPQEPESLQRTPRKRRYFLMGILFYATNPGILVFFTGIAVYLRTLEFMHFDMMSNITSALGVTIGSTLWFLCLMILIKRIKNLLSKKTLTIITRISGAGLTLLSLAIVLDIAGIDFSF